LKGAIQEMKGAQAILFGCLRPLGDARLTTARWSILSSVP